MTCRTCSQPIAPLRDGTGYGHVSPLPYRSPHFARPRRADEVPSAPVLAPRQPDVVARQRPVAAG